MGGSNSIVNLGDLAKPATVLIEKISEAVGGIFKPYQIRRVALAEADAGRIEAAAKIEITELQRRAMARFFAEEAKKQSNIEAITSKALPELTADSRPQNMEDDWIANFFDRCRLISDEDMQALWAKVLSGEANSPGRFSKRTVNLLSSLDKSDAELFNKLCGFAITLNSLLPLIYDFNHAIYTGVGINFGSLSHLETTGLIHFDALAGYIRRGLSQKGFIPYFDQKIWVEFPQTENNSLQLGKVLLTKAGEQLAPVCAARPCDGFVEYVREKWRSFGYKIESPAGS